MGSLLFGSWIDWGVGDQTHCHDEPELANLHFTISQDISSICFPIDAGAYLCNAADF